MLDYYDITEIIYSYATAFIIFLFHIFTSRYFAEFTTRKLGWRVDPWFFILLLFPVVSHIMIILVILVWDYRSRLSRRLFNALDRISRILKLDEISDFSISTAVSVTPFESHVMENILELTSRPTTVFDEWRDVKLDELIEWKQWGKAFELARERLKIARTAGDRRSQELYQAYLGILSPYVDLSLFGKDMEEPPVQNRDFGNRSGLYPGTG